MEEYYTIKEVANRTGISEHTLRYYDKEGLLSFIKRNENGVRIFTKADFEHLYTITVLKRIGMPLKTIRDFMQLILQGNGTIHERAVLYQKQKESIHKQIEDLQEVLKFIELKCEFFEKAEKYGDMEFFKNLPEDEIDPGIKEYRQMVDDFREGRLR